MNKEDKVISAKNISRIYNPGHENQVKALDGVSIDIGRGEFVAIIGPSGSGKSTLMHIIGALEKPTGGSVLIDGDDITKRDITKLNKLRANKIGFVFQSFNLIPDLTARENILLAGEYAGNKANAHRDVDGLLKLVGLAKRGDHYPNQLSGGEQQRVSLARALINKPALILADEPTGQLDTKTSREIIIFMRELARKNNQTVVIVTHNDEVSAECSRIIRLRDGKVVSGKGR